MSICRSLFLLALLFLLGGSGFAQEKQKPLGKEVLNTLYEGTTSQNRIIRNNSYAVLYNQPDLVKHLGADRLARCIADSFSNGLQLNGELGDYGFFMLDNSKLSVKRKQDLLISAIASPEYQIVNEAYARLTESREELLVEIVEKINAKPTGRYRNEIRLLEYWKHKSSPAVPALVKHFEALHDLELEKEIKKLSKRSNDPRSGKKAPSSSRKELTKKAEQRIRFEYLDIVYALSEIGPAARPAIPIALAAAKQKYGSDKSQYQMAGLICINSITNGRTGLSDKRRGANEVGDFRGGALGGALYNMMGSNSSKKSAREVVANYVKQKARTRTPDYPETVNQQVELIFQNHDLLTQKGQLTLEEIRTVTPPVLISKVDRNGDKMVSKDELYKHLMEKAHEKSWARYTLTSRNSSSQNSRSRSSNGR